MVISITFLCLMVVYHAGSETVSINLHNSPVIHRLNPKFVGVTLDTYSIKAHWGNLDLKSPKVITLAKGLAPCYFRIGGTDADYLVFDKNNHQKHWPKHGKRFIINTPRYSTFTMTTADWDDINQFVQQAGLDLIFDFNSFLRKDGHWDPTNAKDLLNYSISKGYKLAGIELGNELEYSPTMSVSAQQDAYDFKTLKQTLSGLPALGRPLIFGPDVANLDSKSMQYAQQFLWAGGKDVVDIITLHHYYMSNEKATVSNFHSAQTMDSLIPRVTNAIKMCNQAAPGKAVWLGETSTAYDYMPNSIDNLYVASFLWLDKLGVATRNGIGGLLRQAFYGALIDNNNMNPTNDYWITVLYKRLVGPVVLNIGKSSNSNIRYYAHCTHKTAPGYERGSVTVYIMNIGGSPINININGINGNIQHQYILSPGDNSGLKSPSIKLNGAVLKLYNDYQLPNLNYKQHSGSFTLYGYNMGFIVLPKAGNSNC